MSLVGTCQIAGKTQPAADKVSVSFFLFVFVTFWSEKEDSLENWHSVLFRLIKTCSVNLLHVFDLFSERRQSTLFLFFFSDLSIITVDH